MGNFILYFLFSIKLNFKQMFYAFIVVLYNFRHVVDVMCGFFGYDQCRCCRMYCSQFLQAAFYCWWYLACPCRMNQQNRAVSTAAAVSAVLLIQTLVSIDFSYKFLRTKVFSFLIVHCFFPFPQCTVFWAWFCLNQNGCKCLRETKGTIVKIYVQVQEVNQNANFLFLPLVISVSKLVKNNMLVSSFPFCNL